MIPFESTLDAVSQLSIEQQEILIDILEIVLLNVGSYDQVY